MFHGVPNFWNEVTIGLLALYIVNSSIRHLKQHISSLHHFNVLSDQEYEYFLNLPKKDREVKIGLMIVKEHYIQVSVKV